MTPLEVMMEAMTYFRQQAAEADDPAQRAELQRLAGKIAAQIAPYLHPQPLEMSEEDPDDE
jgi:hypothetical protein